jgi:hypothetical protein
MQFLVANEILLDGPGIDEPDEWREERVKDEDLGLVLNEAAFPDDILQDQNIDDIAEDSCVEKESH